MDGSLRIGRLFDIPILLHYTFLLVIPLFAYIIGSEIGATTDMLHQIFEVKIDTSVIESGLMPWILGTIVALGLFLGVFVHELAHSLVARARGNPDAEHHAFDVRRWLPRWTRGRPSPGPSFPWPLPARS